MKCTCKVKKDPCPKCTKFIVLDIDATLICTMDPELASKYKKLKIFNPENKDYRDKVYIMNIPDVTKDGKDNICRLEGVKRPFLTEFLIFCNKYFDEVIIWTAGVKLYGEKIIRDIYPYQSKHPILILNRSHCKLDSNGLLQLKPLADIFKMPELKGRANMKNTLVVDDKDQTFACNPDNGIKIPIYESKMTPYSIKHDKDDHLRRLMGWLMQDKVRDCTDVKKLDKKKIFKTRPEAYLKILEKQKSC